MLLECPGIGRHSRLDDSRHLGCRTGRNIVVQGRGRDGRDINYAIAPEDVGISRTDYEQIAATGDLKSETMRFLKVICGVDYPACRDITCFNAGAIFYLTGKVDSIKEGVTYFRELIENKAALKKLCEWVSVQTAADQSGVATLVAVSRQAGLESEIRPILNYSARQRNCLKGEGLFSDYMSADQALTPFLLHTTLDFAPIHFLTTSC